MALKANRETGSGWCVGNHDVDVMNGKVPQKTLKGTVLPANELHGLTQAEGRFNQLVRDGLGNHVRDAHHESDRASDAASLDRTEKLASEPENLVRVPEGDAADVGEHEPAPFATKELLAKDLFEPVDLRANRGVGEPQLLGRTGDAALFRDDPEVEQVVVVEPFHLPGII